MIDDSLESLNTFAAGATKKTKKRAREDNGSIQPVVGRRLDSSDEDEDEDEDSDDASPPRKMSSSSSSSSSTSSTSTDNDHHNNHTHHSTHASSDSDAAPRRRHVDDSGSGSDSDASPPRRGQPSSSTSSSSSSISGLVTASDFQKSHEKQMRKKAKELKRIEADRAIAEARGQGPSGVIHRDGKGNIIDFKKTQREREQAKKTEEQLWTTGKAQREKLMKKFEHMQNMAAAPFAQYSNNEHSTRDGVLRNRNRVDDPMAQFDVDSSSSSSSSSSSTATKKYRGPPGPSNRFGILPGYRWDGVDRGLGFEAKVIENLRKNRKTR